MTLRATARPCRRSAPRPPPRRRPAGRRCRTRSAVPGPSPGWTCGREGTSPARCTRHPHIIICTCAGWAQNWPAGPAVWLEIPTRAVTLAQSLGQPCRLRVVCRCLMRMARVGSADARPPSPRRQVLCGVFMGLMGGIFSVGGPPGVLSHGPWSHSDAAQYISDGES